MNMKMDLPMSQRIPNCGNPPEEGGGVLLVLWGGKLFVWGIFILNKIWVQDILVGTLLDLNMKLALFYNLNFTEVYINFQKYVIR
jgi:hypothetical protein